MFPSFSLSKKRCVIWIGLFAGLALSIILTAVFFRIHRARDLDAYYLMIDHAHPVWKALALRQINDGDAAANVLRHFPASPEIKFGRSALYTYESGGITCAVGSRDGKIVSGEMWSASSKFVFFYTNDAVLAADMAAWNKKNAEELPGLLKMARDREIRKKKERLLRDAA